MQQQPKPVAWAGMTLMLLIGFIHLISAPDAFEDALLKGVLVVVVGISALIAASGIQEGARGYGWGLGSLIAAAALAGFIANATIGLPGLPAEPDAWQNSLAIAALLMEVAIILLAAVVFLTAQRPRWQGAHRTSG